MHLLFRTHSEKFCSIELQDSVHLKERITTIIPTVTPKKRNKKSTTLNRAFIIFHSFTTPTIKCDGNNFMNLDNTFHYKEPIASQVFLRLEMLHL